MIKRISILYSLILICTLALFSAQDRLVIISEKANIYAEPFLTSYLIETLPYGTVLILFQKGKIKDAWYYVRFQSQKYSGTTSGFIQSRHVQPFTGEVPPKKEAQRPPDLPPMPEVKPTEKKPEITKQEIPADTILPASQNIPLSQTHSYPQEKIWLQTDLESAFTTTPAPKAILLPAQVGVLQERIWDTLPAPKAEPEPVIEEPTIKKPVIEEPPVKEPVIEEPAIKEPRVESSFSDKIQLLRDTESFEFDLLFSPFSRFRHFEMTDPNRIVVDFYDVEGIQPYGRYNVNELGIDAIRIGMFQENITRVVFDFATEIPAYQIQATDDGLKILFWMSEAAPSQIPETKIEVIPTDTTLPQQNLLTPFAFQPRRQDRIWLQSEESLAFTSIPGSMPMVLPALPQLSQALVWEIVVTRPTPLPEKKPAKQDLPPPPVEPPKKEVEVKEEITEPEKEEVKEEQIQVKPTSQQPTVPAKAIGPFILSLGIGTSQGGIGAFVQYNIRWGLAFHAGGGYYPTSLIYSETDWVKNEMLFSVGVKYYLPFKPEIFRPYLNLQYGGFGVEAVQVIVGIWEYEYIYENEQKVLYGPSVHAGSELKLGTLGLNAAIGFSYATTSWEWLSQSFYFSADFSVLYYF